MLFHKLTSSICYDRKRLDVCPQPFRLRRSKNAITFASSTETLDASVIETTGRQKNVQAKKVITLKNAEEAEDRSCSSFDLTPTKSKNEGSAQSEKLPMSNQIVETTIRSVTDKCWMQQQEKQAEAVLHSTLEETSKSPFDATLSVFLQRPEEDLEESKQDATGFQNDRYHEKCQSGKLSDKTMNN